jgi:hypothetical protein
LTLLSTLPFLRAIGTLAAVRRWCGWTRLRSARLLGESRAATEHQAGSEEEVE